MPLSVWFLRFAGPCLLINRPPHVHGRNTLEPLHPYHYGFQQVEYPTIRTSGVAVLVPGHGYPVTFIDEFTPFLAFPPEEVRRVICTTDEIVKRYCGCRAVFWAARWETRTW